mmetsp:Transcript_5841/g.13841  ORF Transcript_5841/g.13841 Transcript_5841/m.13841 type:complete len:178 (-) Transcript_5841:155-688(-)
MRVLAGLIAIALASDALDALKAENDRLRSEVAEALKVQNQLLQFELLNVEREVVDLGDSPHNGTTISMAVDDVVKVHLRASGGTGYSWRYLDPSAVTNCIPVVTMVHEETYAGSVIGSPVVFEFQLKGQMEGTGFARFELQSPGSDGKLASQGVTALQVQVGDAKTQACDGDISVVA